MDNANLDNSLESIENIIVMSQIIESLKEQQSDFTEDSDEWLEIEKKIVEFECTLFNESVAINLINYETLEEKIVAHLDNLVHGVTKVDLDFVIEKWTNKNMKQESIDMLIRLHDELLGEYL
jgi:hypothetical protein